MRLLLALAVMALLAGCVCYPQDGGTGTTTTSPSYLNSGSTTTLSSHKATSTTLVNPWNIADQDSCEALGGTWDRIGLSPRESCNLPTSDAGKPCSDDGECEGACIAELSDEQKDLAMHGVPVETGGKCTSWRIMVGCQARVNDGLVRGILCVD